MRWFFRKKDGGDGKTMFRNVCVDGVCHLEAIGNVGAGQRVYWFQEPEG